MKSPVPQGRRLISALKRRAMTAEDVRALLDYDPITGVFTRRLVRSRYGANKVGHVREGYLFIGIRGMSDCGAHRLAWLMMTGEWPTKEVDHIDCDRLNNRWSNLREASDQLQAQNRRGARKDNGIGMLGVSPSGSRWRATIKIEGRQKHIGCYATAEEAYASYVETKRRVHPGCTL